MDVALQPATDEDRAFCEQLHRSNMARYMADRNIAWEPQRFLASWQEFENHMICLSGQRIGLLRLLEIDRVLEIRDLQLLPSRTRQGIGTWAIQQAIAFAVARGLGELRLRVFTDNPAFNLYRRMRFQTVATIDGVIHMSLEFPPPGGVA